MIRMEKLTDIIRDKNINLHGLYLYFRTNLEKYKFSRVFRIIFQ
jgi:hypothetical protein